MPPGPALEYEASDDSLASAATGPARGLPPELARSPDPCILVIFGVTGDLAHRKLIPALYDLACHGVLPPEFTIVGFGRQPLDDAGLRAMMYKAVEDHYGSEGVDGELCRRIMRAPRYVQGTFDTDDGFRRLSAALDEIDAKEGTGGNRIFYLSTPPSLFPVIVTRLGEASLARRGAADGWQAPDGSQHGYTRLVVEKPFGRDLASAQVLNETIQRYFDEPQVYRIDHYLAKETVQNILALRFANGIFEPIWNRRYIDYVQITAAETLGVEHRGAYYEEAGALRDMIKPHLMQLFALTAMEPPVVFTADAVRDEKVKVLRAVRPIPPGRVDLFAARGQYIAGRMGDGSVRGYREEPEVAPDSAVETYAAVKLLVDNWRWQGVPFYLRTGKRLPKRVTEIAIQFRRPPYLLYRAAATSGAKVAANLLLLRIQPDEGISLRIETKVPGQDVALRSVELDYSYGSSLQELPFSAYETLLVDCMEGDATLFKRSDQVEQAWRLMGPVLDAWSTAPQRGLPVYEAGTWGPEEADGLIARDGHTWRQP